MSSVSHPPICGIYKITNTINGKVYIGQSRDIQTRKSQHKYDMRNGGHNEHLYRAMRKYGFDNFEFEVLEECEIHRLNDLEKKYIEQYNSMSPDGYNIELGGGARETTSAYTRKKISKALGRAVNQYTTTGKYIRTFDNAREAAESINKNRSLITMCCTGKPKTAGGFQWRYAESGNNDIDPVDPSKCKFFPVSQLERNGDFITTFQNTQKASFATGISASSISNALRGWCKTAGGFIWRYAE